ncbi:hypothetical protein ID866_2955 [Astraeus odoratus]|nr:hypothetical protein ID866_2955 [Astraeus odoratus]
MSDLAAVRAQIKAWERDFRSTRGRDPSVQDIKDQPHMAEKYKLYKKLSRFAAASSSTGPPPTSSENPSTPPRTRPSASPSHTSLPPRSRMVQTVNPLPGFNPFSPVKNKNNGKQTDLAASLSSLSSHRPQPHSANPFATPVKQRQRPRTPSPDPFPSIVQSHQADDASTVHGPLPNTAVSRARKRLRGEPVSPSPDKQKRQRLGSRTVLPVSKLGGSSDVDDDPDVTAGSGGANASFVDDSPMKAPAGGKSFKLLFEDALPTLSLPRKASELAPPLHNKSATLDTYFARGSRDVFIQGPSKMVSHQSNDKAGIDPVQRTECMVPPVAPNVSKMRSSVKRALDGRTLDTDHTSRDDILTTRYALVPPSPPPDELSSTVQSKAKGGSGPNRKKLRVQEGADDVEDEGLDSVAVKVVTRNHCKPSHGDASDLDWDPLLNPHAHHRDPSTETRVSANHHESDTFSVDLPDNLRRVLAISPSRTQNSKEEYVVRCLLHGDRTTHYDATRGGNIWDIGEADDVSRGDTEAEDDWEGEPVPWEVGEL